MRLFLLFLQFYFFDVGWTARILGLFHMPSYSHFVLGESLFKELARRGHQVTMISSFPQKIPVENYTDIPLEILPKMLEQRKKERSIFDAVNLPKFLMPILVGSAGLDFTDAVFQEPRVRDLLRSDARFDLVIREQFLNDAFAGIARRFDAHSIAFSTIGPCVWVNHLVANPNPAAYASDFFLGYPSRMTLLQRASNALFVAYEKLYYHLYFFRKQEEIMRKYLPDADDIYGAMYNVSVVFVNSHVSFSRAVPHVPAMVAVGGLHLKDEPGKLPGDLKEFLDGSKDGAIFFSLGSNVKSEDLPLEMRRQILEAIAKLRANVIWKFNGEGVENMPKNLRVGAWFPQQSILTHPNVKLFITHGGLLSVMEAVNNGVPILGIPIFADQKMNMATAVEMGYAKMLEYSKLNGESFYNAISEILLNSTYSKNVKLRQEALHDNQVKPLDLAVYWTEYVLKHRGAPHLRNAAALELRWYQHYLLDVVLLLLGVFFLIVVLNYYLAKYLLRKWRGAKVKKE